MATRGAGATSHVDGEPGASGHQRTQPVVSDAFTDRDRRDGMVGVRVPACSNLCDTQASRRRWAMLGRGEVASRAASPRALLGSRGRGPLAVKPSIRARALKGNRARRVRLAAVRVRNDRARDNAAQHGQHRLYRHSISSPVD